MNSGKVILVGAGPGDAGLLTLRGAEAIGAAEVVVYDRLVSDEILDMLPRGAERIFVGKQSGNHAVPQDEINKILLKNALDGKLIVRLKGGDPFLFGRGGEELELLQQNGIAFEVVPGVTSAFAAPAYAGIPVTHRDFCSSVHVITGHARAGGELSIDFPALVKADGTLVFLMGVATMGEITGGLIAAGMAADMPAAIIENGTRPNQRVTLGTVSGIYALARDRGVKSPALLVVGRVCSLGERFDWFGNLPLKGRRIAVTRPRDRAGTLTNRLRALGAEVIAYPCIETEHIERNVPAETALRDIARYKWLALTSPSGVSSLCELLGGLNADARLLAPVKIAAVGSATSDALAEIGLRADFVPEKYSAAALARGLTERVPPAGRVLIFRAEEGAGDLTEILTDAKILYDDIAVYRTKYISEKSAAMAAALRGNELDLVCFTSASTVRGFAESLAAEGVSEKEFSQLTAACIGSATEAAARGRGFKTITAKNASIDELINVILEGK
ncbi:MAG: uroporphyrinogen-III C-methyltransferase [Oscillospiraceae bacterium]|jgi:uroporphyrinogen III methyltransferase/synthase|nr:uroporphyrinogen-III C-methyltransferase [Oscillospiraceae bacterium]